MAAKENTPKCPKCGYKVIPLFYSLSCERCENPMLGWFYHAYVLWTVEKDACWDIQRHPIFKEEVDVVAWLAHQYRNSKTFEIRDVLSYTPFKWVTMDGNNLKVAEHYYHIREDHFFEPKEYDDTVILLPSEVVLPDQESILLDKKSRASLGLKW